MKALEPSAGEIEILIKKNMGPLSIGDVSHDGFCAQSLVLGQGVSDWVAHSKQGG